MNTWTPLTAAERKALRQAFAPRPPIAILTWTYCAQHDHCTLTEDLNDSQGVRWCIKAADDGETCDLRTLTAGGRA